jgi:hypothetical protein
MSGSDRLTIPILLHGCDSYLEHVTNKKAERDVAAGWLGAVYFHPQPAELALLSSMGFLGIRAEWKKFAEASCVRASIVIKRFHHQDDNPLSPTT